MQRRSSLAVIACASAATLLAGCGSSSSGGSGSGGTGTNDASQSPAQELTSSVSALGKASTLTTTVKLGATASQISALATAGGSSLTSAEANAIAGAQIAVEVVAPSGKTLSDVTGSGSSGGSGSAVDVTVSDNGTNYLSLRSLNKTLYVQADLKDLFNVLGQGSEYAGLQSEVGALPGFLQALVAGKWVSLPDSAAAGLTGTSTGSSPSPQQEQAIISGLKNILSTDVTVTRESSGSTDNLALSANSRALVKDFFSTVSSAVPSAGAVLGQENLSNVPSQNIGLGAQVTNGALSQLSIDLGQFDPKGKAHLPLELNFSQSGPSISVPSGAVAVNTQELTELLGSVAGGLGTGSG